MANPINVAPQDIIPARPPFTWAANVVEEIELPLMVKEDEGDDDGGSGDPRGFLIWAPHPHPHPYVHVALGLVIQPVGDRVMTYSELGGACNLPQSVTPNADPK